MSAEVIQGSEEWKRLRLGKLTASRVADATAKTKSGYSASRDNLEQFLTYAKAPSVSDVLAKDYPRLEAMLETKKTSLAKKEKGDEQ